MKNSKKKMEMETTLTASNSYIGCWVGGGRNNNQSMKCQKSK